MDFKMLLEGVRTSAGLLAYKFINEKLHVFLAKPGGPFYWEKDLGTWDIPKGGVESGDGGNLRDAAVREFIEEIGMIPKPKGDTLISLGMTNLRYKTVFIWAYEGDAKFKKSNNFDLEWPAGSGKIQSYPEIDTARFFDMKTARKKIRPNLRIFLDRLEQSL